jgi:glycosyltransferase involved in cell wall biosynthesis
MKHYGIYIAYPPTVDLRHEGLGRYLAAFLKGASAQKDVSFSVVCPSWSRESLTELLEAEGVPSSSCQVVSPHSKPIVLRLYEAWLQYGKRPKKLSFIQRAVGWLQQKRRDFLQRTSDRIVSAHSVVHLLWALLPFLFLVVLAVLLSPLGFVLLVYLLLHKSGARLIGSRVTQIFKLELNRLKSMLSAPEDDGFILLLYRSMEQAETARMQRIISKMEDVRAWYAPTAFWPAFNQIKTPRLMCVPDVVLTDFPVGFSNVGGDRFLESFGTVERAIEGGQHFVTYSAEVKWGTLVDRYGVQASQVNVVHHAPNDLSKWVKVRGFADGAAATRNYCHTLLTSALTRSVQKSYTAEFANSNVRFLFYASQMRPNKNVLNLLRAYQYLLRKRLIGHKLIMTGNPSVLPEIKRFVDENNLQNDVLFLHGLKIQELAACYHLADLAVNPSLSEGGCPFTFTEALSVGTPVVMARIPVTEEVLTAPDLQAATFFDPYDWKEMADRIEWALTHRDELLAIQKPTYERLAQRTWQIVVKEHIAVLDRIAEEKAVV